MSTFKVKLPLMEELEPLKQTLRKIDRRVPDALRATFRLGYRALPPEDDDAVASFVNYALPPPPPPPFARAPTEESLHDSYLHRGTPNKAGQALRMDWAACSLPLHGEDAHFGAGNVVGLADGVGGYRKHGVDAGAFSRGLMARAYAEALVATKLLPGGTRGDVRPRALLELAYECTAASGATGASTAVILSLDGNGRRLRWANIGDSGFAVLRGPRCAIAHRSRPQQRRFNRPYQLTGDPRRGESVAQADTGETPVREGDVVVLGTDGLFDNMFDADLERVVRMGSALGFSPKDMADVIAGAAYEMSRSGKKDAPYAVESRKQQRGGGESCSSRGGKEDDITVVVAFIEPAYPSFNPIADFPALVTSVLDPVGSRSCGPRRHKMEDAAAAKWKGFTKGNKSGMKQTRSIRKMEVEDKGFFYRARDLSELNRQDSRCFVPSGRAVCAMCN